MDEGSSLRWLSASTMTYGHHFDCKSDPELQNMSLIMWANLFKAATKHVNCAWRMDLPIEFEDLANESNEQEFKAIPSKDEMSEYEIYSYSSSCAGSE
jgi:hypothetical protein